MTILTEKNAKLLELLKIYYEGIGLKADLKKLTFSDKSREIHWNPYHKSSDRIIYQPILILRDPTIQKIQNKIIPGKPNFSVYRIAGPRLTQDLNIEQTQYSFNPKYLIENRSFLYVLNKEQDTSPEEISDDHVNFMNEIGLKLFEKLNSANNIHHFINDSILSKPIKTLSTEEKLGIKKKSLNQEVVAGLISACLVDLDIGIRVFEARNIIHHKNTPLLNELDQVLSHFKK